MSQRPLAVTLALVLLAVPGVARAQDDQSSVARDLVERLCSAEPGGGADVASCLLAMGAVLGEALPPDVVGALDIDPQAALDEAIGALQDVGVGAALDDAVTRLQGVDLEAAVNDAIAAAQDLAVRTDVDAFLVDGVTTARAVVAEAEAWVTEHAELVCAGSSIGAGVGAAAVVAYLTGSPGLAISAFDRTEQLSRDVCDDVARADPSPAASEGAG